MPSRPNPDPRPPADSAPAEYPIGGRKREPQVVAEPALAAVLYHRGAAPRRPARAPAALPAGEAMERVAAAQLQIVRQAFRRDAEIARVLGVDPAQLVRWEHGQLPDARNRARLAALATAVGDLLERYEPSVIPGWFRAPSVEGGRTPADLLREGSREALLSHVAAAVQGAFS